jgi:hypothetical protein
VEQMLSTEDHGKDLASVQNLLKKHQLMEADIAAHEVCTQTFYIQTFLLDASDQMLLMKIGYCCIARCSGIVLAKFGIFMHRSIY